MFCGSRTGNIWCRRVSINSARRLAASFTAEAIPDIRFRAPGVVHDDVEAGAMTIAKGGRHQDHGPEPGRSDTFDRSVPEAHRKTYDRRSENQRQAWSNDVAQLVVLRVREPNDKANRKKNEIQLPRRYSHAAQ